jgi:hypothetical protein
MKLLPIQFHTHLAYYLYYSNWLYRRVEYVIM